MVAKEPDDHAILCPRCEADAEWFFLDPEKSRVEIACPNCGRYEMAREEWDQMVFDNPELNVPENRD